MPAKAWTTSEQESAEGHRPASSLLEQSPEDFETVFRRDNQPSTFGYAIGVIVSRCGADFSPRAPVDAQSRQSFRLTIVGQPVDKRIRGRMVRLPG